MKEIMENEDSQSLQFIFDINLRNFLSNDFDKMEKLSALFEEIDKLEDFGKKTFTLKELKNKIIGVITDLSFDDKEFMKDVLNNDSKLENLLNEKSKGLNLGTKIKKLVSQQDKSIVR